MSVFSAAAGEVASLTDPKSEGSAATPNPVQVRLERVRGLDGAALREEWRRLCRSEPPRISRDLLLRAVAYRLQELEFGGLPKWARQSLAGAANASDPADVGEPTAKPVEPRLRPGARVIREWRGRTHTVIVLDDGFEFDGKRYRSLTQIAREITGAHWSGPRFFGLAKRSGGAGAVAAPMLSVGVEDTNKEPNETGSEGCSEARPVTANSADPCNLDAPKVPDVRRGVQGQRTEVGRHG